MDYVEDPDDDAGDELLLLPLPTTVATITMSSLIVVR
jgi:hypothetical protein